MRDFINNPFEQEYESENEIDEFQQIDLDFALNPVHLHPSFLSESDDFEDPFAFTEDVSNDPDFDIEDMEDESNSDYSSDGIDDSDGVDSNNFYETYYSTDDDDDDDLDYVTFPMETFGPPDESSSVNSDQGSDQSEEI